MAVDSVNVKKELIQYLLSKVKERELDPELVKRYIKELGNQPKIELEPIALVGMACRYPNADNVDRFWDNIASGCESISSFPEKRLDDFKRISKINGPLRRGGFLESVDGFDAEYFNIPPRVALHMDPYHRLMLEVLIETIEDAGYHRNQLQGHSIGIFVGNDHTHRLSGSYFPFIADQDFTTITGSWTGVLASRLSYLLNLRGPAAVLDAACSSTLIALDYAIKAIRQGDCEAALVGSINLLFDPVTFDNGTQSGDYVVRAFDKDANGTVWSEGVGAVYIKPLSNALADGDHVYGVIRGIAANNDGKSNGLTAPSAKAQQEVLLKAWERSGISPETISYIEAHGTGTTLGDPIEIKGLTGAFSKYTGKRQFCAIGSIKSNIGHTVGNAGMASIIKVLLCLRERALPPSINFKEPNPFIDFCNSPVYMQDRLTPWDTENVPRRAGISSFSLSGTNCHMVIEEAPDEKRSALKEELAVYPISGRTPELLKRTVLRHLEYMSRHQDMRFEDVCFTACTGREHHPVRAVVICRNLRALAAGLEFLAETLSGGEVDIALLREEEAFSLLLTPKIGSALSDDKLNANSETEVKQLAAILVNPEMRENMNAWKKLSELYVHGAEINFDSIFTNWDVKHTPIPPQVFDNKRYWDETPRNLDEKQSGSDDSDQETELDAASLWNEACAAGSRLPAGYESSGKVENLLAWLWSETLGYPVINPKDDFYAMGGDSINSLKIIQVLNMAFGLELPPSSLLGSPVFKDFVRTVCKDCGFTDTVLESQLNVTKKGQYEQAPEADQSLFTLSPAQNRIFLSVSMMPDSIAYNVTGVERLPKREDVSEIERLMRCLIERHESLRTSFCVENGTPMQVIHSKAEFAVERITLKYEADEAARMNKLQSELKKFIRPFDLGKAPLMRVGYFEFEDKEAYFAIDLHHIITDGTSMGILFAEYAALAEGRKLAPLTMRYRDAVTWLRNRLSEPSFIKQRKWWMEQFSDGIPVLELHTDKPRPVVQNHRGSRVFHMMPATLTARLKALAKDSGATMFTVMIAAFHNLLAKLGGGRDIVIGTPVAGRPRLEFQSIIGMFVNTLPIRTKSTDEESFLDFLNRLKTIVMETFDNQEYSYEALIEDLKPERNPSRNPLFDVYFVMQNIDMGLTGSMEKFIEFDSETAKFDLTVVARETPEGLLMEWEYAEALYHRSSIERIARRFERLITSLVENPHTALGDLDIMVDGERALILEEFNNNATPAPLDLGIVTLFEEWVSLRGKEYAVIMDGKHLSYEELNACANRIARTIVSHGVAPGSGVALLLQRSFDMVAAILGVLKAGCYYIPMDAENPAARLKTMMEDGGAKLLVTHRSLEQQLKKVIAEGFPILDLDYLDPQLPEHNLDIKTGGEDVAYVMYTSGSTGIPKGSTICHKSVIRVVRNSGYIDINTEDVFLQLSNYSFDGSVFDIFGALLNGAPVVLLHRHEVTDPKVLGRLIRENKVSMFFITVALFNALVDASPECLDGTRKVIFGGDAASVHHVRRAYERLGPGRLLNGYGPTETTVFAATYSVDAYPGDEGVPIGRAIGNTTLYVLDDNMRLQPVGVPGELYIGGKGLSLGYLNKPDLTNERFIENPFSPGERLYRTGDLVVWGDDNYLRYLGRRDQQVKLRGYRIELGEIETAALTVKSVREAHAGVHTDGNGVRNLCLWVVTDGNPEVFDTQALRQSLTVVLPSYMVPTFILPIADLPLNKNGKVDKAQLPVPQSAVKGEIREPRNEREMLLSDVWTQVLGIGKPSIDDNFFALGGDSIKAIQIVARIHNAGLTVEMEDIFLYQTIEALAPHLKDEYRTEVEQGTVQGFCEPDAIQSWFLSTGIGPKKRFNQAMLIKGNTKWNEAKLEAALVRLCRHHDALRLAVSKDGRMRLRDLDDGSMYYLSDLPQNLSGEKLNNALIEVQKHIDPENGPLVAAAVGQDCEGVQIFIAIHHMAVDVVSWGVIIEDMITCLMNADATLPKKTTSFLSWTQALNEWAKSGGARGELPYWRTLAKEAKELPVPFAPISALRRDTVRVEHLIDGEMGKALCGMANSAYHTETQHLVLAVIARALCAWTKSKALLVNLEGHGREEFLQGLDISRTVGWFTSTYPVLLKAGGEVGDAVKAVKEAVRGVPRRGFSFGVLRRLDTGLEAEAQALLDSLCPSVSFNYLGVQEDTSFGGISIKALPAEVTVDSECESSWALDIVAAQVGSALSIEIRYPRELFSEEDFKGFLVQLGETANEVAAHCSGRTIEEKTASDFTATKLHQDELENILDDLSIE